MSLQTLVPLELGLQSQFQEKKILIGLDFLALRMQLGSDRILGALAQNH